ncbi:unnamed protein product [Lampetra fluviatilis]
MARRCHLYEELDIHRIDLHLEVPTYELLQEQLNAKFAGQVEFAMNHKTSKLRMKGSEDHVENASQYIASSNKHIVKSRCKLNHFLEEFLQSTDLAQFSQKHLKENGIRAVCANDCDGVYVWSLKDHLELADATLKEALKGWPFPLTEEHARMASGEDWGIFFKQLEHKFSVSPMSSCKFTFEKNSDDFFASIYIAGYVTAVYKAERELANFFKQHTNGETNTLKGKSPSARVNNHLGLNDGAEFSQLQSGAMDSSRLNNNDVPLYATVNKLKVLKDGAEFSDLQGGSVDDSRLNGNDFPLYATVNKRKELKDGEECGELQVNKHQGAKDGARFKELGNGYVEIGPLNLNEDLLYAQVNTHSGQKDDKQFGELQSDPVKPYIFKYEPLYESISFSGEDEDNASKESEESSELQIDVLLSHMNPILKNSLLVTHKLPGGRFLYLHIGDMLTMPVDVMVNAANENLDHMGGLAKALSDAAGPSLQRESNGHVKKHGKVPFGAVAITGPGRLPCKKVFHVVGPQWTIRENSANNGQVGIRRLNMAIVSALEAAEEEGFNSIALPAISSGIYGFPVPLCAKTIYTAILVYCGKTKNFPHTLTNIHVIDLGDEFVMEIMNLTQEDNDDVILAHGSSDHLGTKHGDSETQEHRGFIDSGLPQNQGFVNNEEKHRSGVAPNTCENEENTFMTREGIKITIATGNIEDQMTDVIVNTLSPKMDLSMGSVSSALARKGGPDLQAAVNKKKMLLLQNHFETEPTGDLSCKRVYHVILQLAYRENCPELRKTVIGCLKRAHKANMRSISFPVMGNGKQGYRLEEVAKCMLHAAISFSEQHKFSSLQLIQIVTLSTDSAVVPMFQKEIFFLKNSSQRSQHHARQWKLFPFL